MNTRLEITYRRARGEDAEATFEIFVAAANDLNRKSGRPETAGTGSLARALAFRHHAIQHDGERFWVAEAQGRVIGFAIATLRGDVWYLAALHVLPEFQAHHIGSTLLRHSLAGLSPSVVRTVYTDAINPASNGLYMGFGMLIQEAIAHYEGSIEAARPGGVRRCESTGSDGLLDYRAIELPADLPALEDLDRTTLGAPRGIDHELWSHAEGVHGIMLEQWGRPRGYAYVAASGYIGPIAVSRPTDVVPALDIAERVASEGGASRLLVRVGGSCREAAQWSLDRGLRLSGVGLMLSSSPIGRMDRYVMSSSDALF